jgi:hypothetical protein
MTQTDMNEYQTVVRRALREYNELHPNDRFKHDDGTAKGQEVTMPN